jgi:hypothetical protein
MASAANLASTLVGIPATWLLLFVLEAWLARGAFGLDTPSQRVLAVTLQSPWLIPYENATWMVPAAAVVLCVHFFFMSVPVEYFCAKRFAREVSSSLLWRWSWIANGLTYGCIVIGLLVLLAVQLLVRH